MATQVYFSDDLTDMGRGKETCIFQELLTTTIEYFFDDFLNVYREEGK